MTVLSYWFWLGTMYLIFLTYQDTKNNMVVDDRRNSFMLGLSISIMSHVNTTLLYKLCLTAVIILLTIYLKKFKVVGEADINSLSWIFLGLGLMHPTYLIIFAAFFITLTIIFWIIKRIIKKEGYAPFYAVILLSYIPTAILLKGY
jgi:hypothetical protein